MSMRAPPTVTGHEGGGLDSIVGSLKSPRLKAHFDCTLMRGEDATCRMGFLFANAFENMRPAF